MVACLPACLPVWLLGQALRQFELEVQDSRATAQAQRQLIEEVREENDEVRAQREQLAQAVIDADAEVRQKVAELEALEADADRWVVVASLLCGRLVGWLVRWFWWAGWQTA